jgi:hypothetical protein
MFGRKTDPVKRRNSLLMIAGSFLIIAVINKPSVLLFFASARQFISFALMVFAAFMAALGIHSFAEIVFGKTTLPWYTRPWAILFLAVALIIINVVLMLTGNLFSSIFKVNMFFLQNAYIYLFMALEVLWLVLLEWVSYEK